MMTYKQVKFAGRYSGKLGAIYSPEKTIFRLWQPFAEKAFVRFYNENGSLAREAEMTRRGSVFEYTAAGNTEGVYYTFVLQDNRGRTEFADIYAALVNDSGTKARVVDMKKNAPPGWEKDRFVKCGSMNEAVIYELSVRDFSMDGSADFTHRGKFSAFCEKNVAVKNGGAAGMEYIKSLGVTHIQLMPVFDFDSDGGDYNWGYNPRFFNAPSGYYSEKNGIYELRELVAEAHKNGIGVVADVVYNHVYSAGDSSFEKQVPGYFFRGKNGYSNGSGCGNEFASERPMARKFILDSLEFLTKEYHFDGFRFDLMGLLDIGTLKEIGRKLRRINPDILLYGEGWTGGKSVYPERFRAVRKNAAALPGFAFFNDSFRDGVKGSVFDAADSGLVNGNPDSGHKAPVCEAISGKFSPDFWTDDSSQTVNYVECHDNLTLFDKLNATLENADFQTVVCCDKMAAALVMLSAGAAFIAAGQEFLRSKNGCGNSYNAGDEVNSLKWNLTAENRETVDYYRGLIRFRKAHRDAFIGCNFSNYGEVTVAGKGDFLLIINPTDKAFHTDIPGEVFIDGNRASDEVLYTKKRLSAAAHSLLAAKIQRRYGK